MATVHEIVKGLSQVVANSYDGALDENGDPVVVGGLNREEGDKILDSRVIDGFKIRVQDNQMILSYQSEVMLSETHEKDFEDNVKNTLNDVLKFIKKEYKKVTGESISLKQVGEPDIQCEYISRVRSTVRAVDIYEIKGVKSQQEEKKLDNSIKDWLKLGKGGKYESVPK
jgi:hypothetical protein